MMTVDRKPNVAIVRLRNLLGFTTRPPFARRLGITNQVLRAIEGGRTQLGQDQADYCLVVWGIDPRGLRAGILRTHHHRPVTVATIAAWQRRYTESEYVNRMFDRLDLMLRVAAQLSDEGQVTFLELLHLYGQFEKTARERIPALDAAMVTEHHRHQEACDIVPTVLLDFILVRNQAVGDEDGASQGDRIDLPDDAEYHALGCTPERRGCMLYIGDISRTRMSNDQLEAAVIRVLTRPNRDQPPEEGNYCPKCGRA